MAFFPIFRARSAVGALAIFFFVFSTGCGPIDLIGVPDGGGDAAIPPGDGSVDGTPGDSGARDAAPAPDAGPPPEALDDFVRWEMEQGGIPGLAAAIVADGGVAWQGLYGFADVDAAQPVTERTLFGVGSVTKTLILTRVLQLAEAGTLDLDAPLDDVLPFPVRHPDFPDVSITPRMLMTHTSGLADDWLVLGGVTTEGVDNILPLVDFARGYVTPGGAYWGASNFRSRAGTEWDYCNAGWAVLAAAGEEASGEGFRESIGAQIFTPLGMDDSGFFLADVDPALLATPYTYDRGHRRFDALMQPGYGHWPATGLRTNVVDMARFARMWLGSGTLDGVQVLGAATAEAAFGLQVPSLSARQALGFRYRNVAGRRYVGHSGATIGGSAQLLLRPADGKALILMTNGDSYVRDRFGFTEGADAIERILERLDAESDAY